MAILLRHSSAESANPGLSFYRFFAKKLSRRTSVLCCLILPSHRLDRVGSFLRFVRGGWINPAHFEARSSLQSVQYVLRDGALVREVTLRPDATAGTPVATRVLLEDVKSIDLGFVRGGQRSDFWQGDAVTNLAVLPDLIEMNIAFENNVTLSISALTGGRA